MPSFFTEGSNYKRYGPLNSHDVLKFIALLGMTADHVGSYLLPECLWLRAIGRVATPAWFFLAGFSRPSRPFSFELLFLAVFMVAVSTLTFHPLLPTNVLVTIIACRAAIFGLEKLGWIETRPTILWLMGFIWALPTMILFEYGTLAILYAVMGVICREKLDSPGHRAFCVLAVISFIVFQLIEYQFDMAQAAFVVIATALFSYYGLYRFTLTPVSLPLLDAPAKLLSRYSLYYYAAHRTALQVAAMLLYPATHATFTWMGS